MAITEVGELLPCSHCHSPSEDLEIQIVMIAIVDSKGIVQEDPQERRFVYCSGCGHWADLETWDDRP